MHGMKLPLILLHQIPNAIPCQYQALGLGLNLSILRFRWSPAAFAMETFAPVLGLG